MGELKLHDMRGGELAVGDEALSQAADLLRAGAVLAYSGRFGIELVSTADAEGLERIQNRRRTTAPGVLVVASDADLDITDTEREALKGATVVALSDADPRFARIPTSIATGALRQLCEAVGPVWTAPARIFAGAQANDVADVFEVFGNGVEATLEDETDTETRTVLEFIGDRKIIHRDHHTYRPDPKFHRPVHEALALAANETGLERYVAVIWDYGAVGADQTIWGGEFFTFDGGKTRAALHGFRWMNNKSTRREPWRSAVAMQLAAGIRPSIRQFRGLSDLVDNQTVSLLADDIDYAGVQCHAAGRLFEGMASILGLTHVSDYPGQGMHTLEAAARRHTSHTRIPEFLPRDWREVLQWALLSEDVEESAWRFFAGMADLVVWEAVRADLPVVVAGDVFRNRLLLELLLEGTDSKGIELHWPQSIPIGSQSIPIGLELIND